MSCWSSRHSLLICKLYKPCLPHPILIGNFPTDFSLTKHILSDFLARLIMKLSLVTIVFSVAALLITAQTVNLGPNGFDPETIQANIGQFVTFHVTDGGPHTVSESTARLSDHCNTEGGFDSGNTFRQ